MYLMFLGPYFEGGDWNDRNIVGIRKFFGRMKLWLSLAEENGHVIDVEELEKKIDVYFTTFKVNNKEFQIPIEEGTILTFPAFYLHCSKEQKSNQEKKFMAKFKISSTYYDEHKKELSNLGYDFLKDEISSEKFLNIIQNSNINPQL